MKRFYFIGLILLLAVIPALGAAAPTVKVGLITCMTGRLSGYHKKCQKGWEMALEDINKTGIKSLGGAKIDLIMVDDRSDPAVAAKEAERLITVEKVNFIMGSETSDLTLAIQPICARYKVPLLNRSGSADVLYTKGSKYFWGVGIPPESTAVSPFFSFFEYLVKQHNLKADRIAIIDNSTTMGRSHGKALKEKCKKAGYNVVIHSEYNPRAKDLVPMLTRIQALNPDVLFGSGHGGITLHKGRHVIGFRPFVMGIASAYGNPNFNKLLPPEVMNQTIEGMFASIGAPDDLRRIRPRVENLLSRLEAKYGKETPIWYYPLYSYQPLYLMAKVLEACGSTDPDVFMKTARALKVPAKEMFVGSAGIVTWDETGKPQGEFWGVVQWQDGMPRCVWPKEMATTVPRLTKEWLR